MLLGNEHGIIEHPRQKWLRERAKSLGYPYIASSVCLGYSFFIRPLIYPFFSSAKYPYYQELKRMQRNTYCRFLSYFILKIKFIFERRGKNVKRMTLLALLTDLKPIRTIHMNQQQHARYTFWSYSHGNAAEFLALLEFPFGEKLRQRAQVA